MNVNELVQKFISHAPDFYSDMKIGDLDNKHSEIVKSAYDSIETGKAFKDKNFRNWSAQSDLEVPMQLSTFNFKTHGFLYTVLKFFYVKIFRRDVEKAALTNILDDISIIKAINGEKLLKENPAHTASGASTAYFTDDKSVNLRLLRYTYICQNIINHNLLSNSGVWVDVGSYYGGCQNLLYKKFPNVTNVLVDFHHQLCRSYIFLSQSFPDANHILPDEVSNYENLESIPKGSFVYLPVSDYYKIENQQVSLVSNFFSLGEMRREFHSTYMNSSLFKKSKKTYLINRWISSPFFEKTYDTDISILDYMSNTQKIDYFDMFPMHHYQLMKREIHGRVAQRSKGSSYFEMMTSRKNNLST